MTYTILDCYTDEPAGLGVPPYLGTYPRYIAGFLGNINYITIDDLRYYKNYLLVNKKSKKSQKTNIKIYNLTKNIKHIKEIFEKTSELIVVLGVHTPGKYLSAVPGTLKEVSELIKDFNFKKVLTGPAVYGTRLEGGKFAEKINLKVFDGIEKFDFSYNEINELAVNGASIIKQIPDLRVIEIETSRGCSRKKGCSFCTEPIKHRMEFRNKEDILREIKEFYKLGCRYFRLGKQSCIYSYPNLAELLKDIRKDCKEIKVLHVDNANPNFVTEEKTKAIVKYCTEGNVAAFGVESFDKKVIKENNLNATPEQTFKAIKILNKYGAARGFNGMPKLLPGINLLFGLKAESKKTNEENMKYLKMILDNNLLLRRINIRQVTLFEGTPLYEEVGNKFLRKNKKYYWKWRNDVRQKIDNVMLKRLVPSGTLLRNVRMEIYDGNTTFGRQIGTYPLIVGVKGRLELGKFYDVRVKSHMLRSVVGEIIELRNQ